MKYAAILCLVLVHTAPAQGSISFDSVRVTVSPDCTKDNCWPYGVVLSSTTGHLEFAQDVHRYETTIPPRQKATLFRGVGEILTSTLPDRIDGDSLLCLSSLPHQPVITVAFYRDRTERRIVDFRWCGPAASGSTDAARKELSALTQLRAFEDAILALPSVTSHVKA